MKKQSDGYWKDTLWDIALAIILLCLLIKLGIADYFDEYGGIAISVIAVIYGCIYEILKRKRNK